jgi:hypothetical protein
MSVLDVSNALRHVHNNLEIETQWKRATDGLKRMDALQRAQVWTTLSSHTLNMEQPRAMVVFSQYKALFKAALKSDDEETQSQCCECKCDGSQPTGGDNQQLMLDIKEVIKKSEFMGEVRIKFENILDEYREKLQEYHMFLTALKTTVDRDGDANLILEIKNIINSSQLLVDMKAQIRAILEASTRDTAKNAAIQQMISKQDQLQTLVAKDTDMAQLKAALISVQAEKASESSVAKMSEILATMQTKLDILTSKLGNSTLGALAQQVNDGAIRIGAMETSHDKLRESIDNLYKSFRSHTTEIMTLKSDLKESQTGIDNMIEIVGKLTASVGDLTREKNNLTDGIKQLSDAYSESTAEINRRIEKTETSHNDMKLAINELNEESKSHARIEDVRQIIDQLMNAEEEQEHTAESGKPPGRQEKPQISPLARNQHKGGRGVSKIIEEMGLPPAALPRERSTSISPPRRPPWRGPGR